MTNEFPPLPEYLDVKISHEAVMHLLMFWLDNKDNADVRSTFEYKTAFQFFQFLYDRSPVSWGLNFDGGYDE